MVALLARNKSCDGFIRENLGEFILIRTVNDGKETEKAFTLFMGFTYIALNDEVDGPCEFVKKRIDSLYYLQLSVMNAVRINNFKYGFKHGKMKIIGANNA